MVMNVFSKEHRARKPPKVEKPPKQRKPVRPISKKLAKERETYRRLREEFLKKPENMFCAVYPHLRASQIHHPFGRLGEHLNATHEWIAVSAEGHQKIEMEPAWAKEVGFSGSRLELKKPLNKY